jgi:hypothetical protein
MILTSIILINPLVISVTQNPLSIRGNKGLQNHLQKEIFLTKYESRTEPESSHTLLEDICRFASGRMFFYSFRSLVRIIDCLSL